MQSTVLLFHESISSSTLISFLFCHASYIELSVFFKPAFYSVPEGDFLQIVLQANKHFEVQFTIDVTIVEGTAVGKCLVHILHTTQYTAGKALLMIRIRVCVYS